MAELEHPPRRKTGAEMGLVVSLAVTLAGLAFNAGVQYAHISNLETRTGSLEIEYGSLHDSQQDGKRETQVTLTRIQTTLEQMQTTQKEIRTAIRSKP